MAVCAFQTPSKDIIKVDQMSRVSIFDEGVGIFDSRGRMIGWIGTTDDDEKSRISDILLEIMDNPRRAKQPDFSFMREASEEVRATVVMPQRKKGSNNGNPGDAAGS